MLTAPIQELLRKIKAGVYEPAAVELVERTSREEFLAEFDSEFPLRFQERWLGKKWEVGLAHSLRHEIGAFSSRKTFFPLLFLIPVFRRCLFLSGEEDHLTGIALASRLTVRPIGEAVRELALTTGKGFKLDKAPDGWSLKPVEKRTVRLSEDFLRTRGWRFDTLWSFGLTARTGKGNQPSQTQP